jgi:hypothetical protein
MKRTKQFELKPCSECGSEYKHYATKRTQLCPSCTKKSYLKRNRLTEEEKKKSYPLDKKEQKRRYTRLRQGLAKCETREEKQKFYDAVLKEMIDTGIYLWCVDLRMPVKPQERGSGIRGRKPKSISDMRQKHPDTRQMHE